MIRLRHLLVVISGLVWMFTAASAEAADENQVIFPGGAPAAAAPAAPATARVGFTAVAAIVLLAAAGGWMLWKGKKVHLGGREAKSLAIDETRSLGNRQYLVVASYNGQKLLLGVCPGRIDLLSPVAGTREEKAQ